MPIITLQDTEDLYSNLLDYVAHSIAEGKPDILAYTLGPKCRATLQEYRDAGEVTNQEEARSMFRVVYHVMNDPREQDYLPPDERKETPPVKEDPTYTNF